MQVIIENSCLTNWSPNQVAFIYPGRNIDIQVTRNWRPMARRTRSQLFQLADQIKNSKALMRGWTRGSRRMRANSNNEDNRPQGRSKHTQTRDDQLMDIIEQAGLE